MTDSAFKKFAIPIAILVLAVLAFLIVKPILTPIILGLCLAYIFSPLYNRLTKIVKSKNLSASIIIILNLLIILIPLILLLPAVGRQIFEVYNSIRNADLYQVLVKVIPSTMENQQFSAEITTAITNFQSQLSGFVLVLLEKTITNIPQIIFGTIILLFTFFFALRESHRFREYFTVLFPFPKEYEDKFLRQFERITNSVLYGQFMVGVFQGIIAAIGYFLLGIPNALLLSILTAIVGVLPFVSPWLVWIPVDILLFITGETENAWALMIYGLFVINWIDTILSPRIVSFRAQLNPAIVLIGIIGGIYAFGIIGVLLGPLILSYLILLIEIYRDRKSESIIFKEEKKDIP